MQRTELEVGLSKEGRPRTPDLDEMAAKKGIQFQLNHEAVKDAKKRKCVQINYLILKLRYFFEKMKKLCHCYHPHY